MASEAERERRRLRKDPRAGAAILCTAVLWGVATALATQGSSPGSETHNTFALFSLPSVLAGALAVTIAIVGVTAAAYLLYLFSWRRVKRNPNDDYTIEREHISTLKQIGLATMALAPVVGLVVAMLFARGHGRQPSSVPRGGTPGHGTLPGSANVAHHVISWPIVTIVGASLALVALALVAWKRGSAYVVFDDGSAPEALTSELDAGEEDLDSIRDPRLAVIACYRHMERAAEFSGTARRAADTPFELLNRMLERLGGAASSARRLTTIFEAAMFSSRAIGEATRSDALRALRAVRSDIETKR